VSLAAVRLEALLNAFALDYLPSPLEELTRGCYLPNPLEEHTRGRCPAEAQQRDRATAR